MADQPILNGLVITPEGLNNADEMQVTFQSIFADRVGLLWHSPTSTEIPTFPGLIGSFQRRIMLAANPPLFIVGLLAQANLQKRHGSWRMIPLSELTKPNSHGFEIPSNADVILTNPKIKVTDKDWLSGLGGMLPSSCADQVAQARSQLRDLN